MFTNAPAYIQEIIWAFACLSLNLLCSSDTCNVKPNSIYLLKCASFLCSFPICSQWKCKLATVYFQLFVESLLTLVLAHFISVRQTLTHNRKECLQHCSQLLILAISSKLYWITHLFIIINHLNPSAAYDKSYCGLTKPWTWPNVSDSGRQEWHCRDSHACKGESPTIPKLLFTVCSWQKGKRWASQVVV